MIFICHHICSEGVEGKEEANGSESSSHDSDVICLDVAVPETSAGCSAVDTDSKSTGELSVITCSVKIYINATIMSYDKTRILV